MGHSEGSSRGARNDEEAYEALDLYGVLTDDDWLSRVEAGYLTADQKRQVREMAYVTLVALADYGVRWKRGVVNEGDHALRSLDLLHRAEQFHEPTRAFYFVRSICGECRGNKAAAEQDAKRYKTMAGQTAWDYFVPARFGMQWAGMDRKEVIRSLQAVLRLQPDHWSSMYHLAAHLQVLNRVPEALQLFSGCLGLKPGWAWAYLDRGDCYWQLGQMADAIADFREAVRLKPTIAEFHYHLGNALIERGKLDEAIAEHREAIRLDPTEYDFHIGLGMALQQKDLLEEAIAEYREAIRLAPKSWCPYGHLAGVLANPRHFGYRDLPQALVLAQKAVKLAPNECATHETLGAVQYRAGDWRAAKVALQKAEELNPEGGLQGSVSHSNRSMWLVRTMTHYRRDWIGKNMLRDEEMLGLRAAAAELLGLADKPAPQNKPKQGNRLPAPEGR